MSEDPVRFGITPSADPNAIQAQARQAAMFPTLTPDQVRRVAPHGRSRAVSRGDVLVPAGHQATSFFVVTSRTPADARPYCTPKPPG